MLTKREDSMIIFNMPKMRISHHWNIFVLLIALPSYPVNGQVDFILEGTSCQSFDATLGCVIGTFASSASWKRGVGDDLVVTCSSTGPCSQISETINGNRYFFYGNSSGIYMSTNLNASEHDMRWTCTYNGNDYIYEFNLSCGQVDFILEGTSCQSFDATLGCVIGTFASAASWKRGVGDDLVVTCSSAGPCSQISQTINGNRYSFYGNSSGIYMSTNLNALEHDMRWTCTYNGNDYIYEFKLSCEQTVTTEMSTVGTTPIKNNSENTVNVTVEQTVTTEMSTVGTTPIKNNSENTVNVTVEQTVTTEMSTVGTTPIKNNSENTVNVTVEQTVTTEMSTVGTTPIKNNSENTVNVTVEPTATTEMSTEGTTQIKINSENIVNKTVELTATTEMSTEGTTQIKINSENIVSKTVEPTATIEMSTEGTTQIKINSENTVNKTVEPTATTEMSTEGTTQVKINSENIVNKTVEPTATTEIASEGTTQIKINSENTVNKTVEPTATIEMSTEGTTQVKINSENIVNKTVEPTATTEIASEGTTQIKINSENTVNKTVELTATTEMSTEGTTQIKINSENIVNKTVEPTATIEMSTEGTTQVKINSENIVNKTVEPTATTEIASEGTTQIKNNSENTVNVTVGPTSPMTTIAITKKFTTVNNIELQQNCTSTYSRCDTDKNISTSTISNINTETTKLYETTFTIEPSIKGGLNEKIKDIIFISTTSAVVTIIVVILFIIFAKVYMSNRNQINPQNDDTLSRFGNSSLLYTLFPYYSSKSEMKYPLSSTSSTSFTMNSYTNSWDDI